VYFVFFMDVLLSLGYVNSIVSTTAIDCLERLLRNDLLGLCVQLYVKPRPLINSTRTTRGLKPLTFHSQIRHQTRKAGRPAKPKSKP